MLLPLIFYALFLKTTSPLNSDKTLTKNNKVYKTFVRIFIRNKAQKILYQLRGKKDGYSLGKSQKL